MEKSYLVFQFFKVNEWGIRLSQHLFDFDAVVAVKTCRQKVDDRLQGD